MRNRRVGLFYAAALAAALAVVGCDKKSGSKVAETSAGNRATESAASVAATSGSVENSNTVAGNSAMATEKCALIPAEARAYQKDDVLIGYPVVNGLTDSAQQEKLSAHLKENALSPIEALLTDVAKDKLTVMAEAVSADADHAVIVYRDEMQRSDDATPVKLFCINTIAVKTLKDPGLRDAVGANSMVNYVPGDTFEPDNVGESKVNAYKVWVQSTGKEALQKSLEEKLTASDFPLKKGKNGKLQRPESFSYAKDGEIYFSISVLQNMGNVVVMRYDMVTK